jgi:uncharacterized protein (UPF0548 family)
VLCLRRPNQAALDAFLARQAGQAFSYAEVGRTAGEPPVGYDFDRRRVRLGRGLADFQVARAALRRWEMFDIGWAHLVQSGPPAEGQIVALLARAFGVWWLNACRVVYVENTMRRFGFAYGTLNEHVERGEELFLIERLDDDSVWYQISAFSRPKHPLVRLAYPLARRLQLRFALGSIAAMERAVQSAQARHESAS